MGESRRSGDDRKGVGWCATIVLSIVVLLGWLPVAVGAGTGEAVVVGIVEAISGSTQNYLLRRDGADVRLRICDQIEVGDRFVVPPDGGIKVRLATGELLLVTASNSDLPIESRGAPATVVSNLLANLASLVTPWHDFVELNFSVRGKERPHSAGEAMDLH